MEEDGYEFSYPPSLDDFEKQLEFSVALIRESSDKSFFDRSPIDFLAYAMAAPQANLKYFDREAWEALIEEALSLLDVIVYVPIEDRIPVPRSEDLALRSNVDEHLRSLIAEDSAGFCRNLSVVEVSGSLHERVRIVEELLKGPLGMA